MNTIKLALDWWHKLPFNSFDTEISKTSCCNKYYKHNNYYSLKDEEIENIFYNEVIVKWWDSSDKLSLMQKYPHYNTDEMYLKEHSKEEPMKNIHLISTDKPNMLRLDDGELVLGNSKLCQNTINYKYQNIYITNDEEIKDGDWFLTDDKRVEKCASDWRAREWHKKIILTTDQDLDGVQAIDDEFLEWFVKNPSCEEVEVININCANCIKIQGQELSPDCCHNYQYKIIIPQEEPKDVILGYKTSLDAQMLDKVEPKQEIFNYCQSEIEDGGKCTIQCDHCKEYYAPLELEEAAFILYPRLINDPYNPMEDDNKEYRDIWIGGAKWKQERSYSEEEVKDLIEDWTKMASGLNQNFPSNKFNIWFEQFKKK